MHRQNYCVFLLVLATIKNSTGGNLVPVTNEGNDIMITCEVISVGNALPTVSWSRNDGILSDRVSVNESVSVPTGSGNVSITSKHLTIINSSREDNGVYKCFANNSVSSDSKDVRIAVQGMLLHKSFIYVYNTFAPQIKGIPSVTNLILHT